MKLQSIGNHIIVKQLTAPTESPGGIVLPQKAQEAPKRGEVISIGILEADIYINVGDIVVFAGYAGTKIEDEYLVLEGKEIIAKVIE